MSAALSDTPQSPHAALRQLANRLVGILYGCLKTGKGHKIMHQQCLHGLPGMNKRFARTPISPPPWTWSSGSSRARPPDQLWVIDIAEHPTREGNVHCCVILDVFSRRVVGWSIDSHQATPLVTNALGMATANRAPDRGSTVIHRDHGTQFTSWAFTQRAKDSGLLPFDGQRR